MSDTIDDFRALRDHRREQRALHGVGCPWCRVARPRAAPSILLPGQRCRVDGFRDPRQPDEAPCPHDWYQGPGGHWYCRECIAHQVETPPGCEPRA